TTRRSERSMGNSSVSTGAGGDRGAGLGALLQVGLPLTASGSARLPASRGRPGPLIRPPQGLLARLSVDFRGVSDLPRTALGSRQVENAQELLREHKVFRTENLVRPRVVQMGEHNLNVGEQLTFQVGLPLDDRSLGPQVGERDLVDELVPG